MSRASAAGDGGPDCPRPARWAGSGRGPAGAARSKGTAAADDSVYADRLASGKTDTQLGAAAIDI